MRICSIKGCGKKHNSKSFCKFHYMQQYIRPTRTKLCEVEGCENVVLSKSRCTSHFLREEKYGIPDSVPLRPRNNNPPSICTIKGCKGKHLAKGLCRNHYNILDHLQEFIWHHAKDEKLLADYKITRRIENKSCLIDGCDRISSSKGLCRKHYCKAYRLQRL